MKRSRFFFFWLIFFNVINGTKEKKPIKGFYENLKYIVHKVHNSELGGGFRAALGVSACLGALVLISFKVLSWRGKKQGPFQKIVDNVDEIVSNVENITKKTKESYHPKEVISEIKKGKEVVLHEIKLGGEVLLTRYKEVEKAVGILFKQVSDAVDPEGIGNLSQKIKNKVKEDYDGVKKYLQETENNVIENVAELKKKVIEELKEWQVQFNTQRQQIGGVVENKIKQAAHLADTVIAKTQAVVRQVNAIVKDIACVGRNVNSGSANLAHGLSNLDSATGDIENSIAIFHNIVLSRCSGGPLSLFIGNQGNVIAIRKNALAEAMGKVYCVVEMLTKNRLSNMPLDNKQLCHLQELETSAFAKAQNFILSHKIALNLEGLSTYDNALEQSVAFACGNKKLQSSIKEFFNALYKEKEAMGICETQQNGYVILKAKQKNFFNTNEAHNNLGRYYDYPFVLSFFTKKLFTAQKDIKKLFAIFKSDFTCIANDICKDKRLLILQCQANSLPSDIECGCWKCFIKRKRDYFIRLAVFSYLKEFPESISQLSTNQYYKGKEIQKTFLENAEYDKEVFDYEESVNNVKKYSTALSFLHIEKESDEQEKDFNIFDKNGGKQRQEDLAQMIADYHNGKFTTKYGVLEKKAKNKVEEWKTRVQSKKNNCVQWLEEQQPHCLKRKKNLLVRQKEKQEKQQSLGGKKRNTRNENLMRGIGGDFKWMWITLKKEFDISDYVNAFYGLYNS